MTTLAPLPSQVSPPWRRKALGPLVRLLDRYGYMRRRLHRNPRLRILTYHGVCSEDVAGEAWVPRHFVTEGHFAQQMRILLNLGRIVRLSDVVEDLVDGRPFDEPCFAITFDDGHACTLRHALPAMDALGIQATFFVTTGHVDRGEGFLSDRLGVLGSLPLRLAERMHSDLRHYVESPERAKHVPYDRVQSMLDEYWPVVADGLDRRIAETLRPVSWTELGDLHRSGHEIAAHTVSHVILTQESCSRREAEIVDSVRRIRENISRCDGFAYPNGGRNDFDGYDVGVLRREGIRYAVTTTPGCCVPPLDRYRLPRTSVGLGHDDCTFALEMSGYLDRRRRRLQVP